MSRWQPSFLEQLCRTATIAVGCISICGCAELARRLGLDQDGGGEARAASRITASAAYRDTVGAYTWVEGLRRMRVRGYGVVIGLGDRGSSECPRQLRQQLVQDMYKRPEYAAVTTGSMTPEKLIDNRDTAVVVVYAEIAAAAPAGSRFDVFVEAVPGTQTTSLAGGTLLPCDLRIFRSVTPAASITGRSLARAAGPIFINPFAQATDAATRSNPRTGTVLGGGVSITDRRVRLVLTQSSYQVAQTIERRINARFGTDRKVADAVSPSFVRLRVPAAFHRDPTRFLNLARHIYLPTTPGFADDRVRKLLGELADPDAPHTDVALALEGIGRTVLPALKEPYSSPRRFESFHASLAGLRLGDRAAIEVMGRHAWDPASPYRMPAIRALGAAEDLFRAAAPLRRLLDDPDPRIRVAAYEALRRRNDRVITSEAIGDGNFVLDVVPSAAPKVIYVKRHGRRRIALLGNDIRCEPPLFYSLPTGELTVNAYERASEVALVRTTPYAKVSAPPVSVPLDVVELVRTLGGDAGVDARQQPTGLGVDYSSVVQVLQALCATRSVNAAFMLEQISIAEFFRLREPPGRPESEL